MHVLTVVRSYLGLSQVALAKAAGITQADLSEMETREPYGKIKKYQRLSEYLELPLDLIVKNDFSHFPVSFFDTHPEPAFTAYPTSPDGIMGRQGEEYIYTREQIRLNESLPALAKLVLPYYKMKLSSPGYDILTFNEHGTPVALEVKTSEKDNEHFRITPNELDAAQKLTASGIPYIICYISHWSMDDQKVREYDFSTLEQTHRIDPCVYLCRPHSKPKQFPVSGLAYFRRKRGLRQTELAEAVGVHACDWNLYENGSRTPPIKVYLQASEILGATIDELVTQYDKEDVYG